jgi:hypothetical protein
MFLKSVTQQAHGLCAFCAPSVRLSKFSGPTCMSLAPEINILDTHVARLRPRAVLFTYSWTVLEIMHEGSTP